MPNRVTTDLLQDALIAWRTEEEIFVLSNGDHVLQKLHPSVEGAVTAVRVIDGERRHFTMRVIGLRNLHVRVWIEGY